MIVTIDGPAGSGKSAAALLLAQQLKIPHLDTGAMYRAVALDAVELGIQNDPDAISARVKNIELAFNWGVFPAAILLNGRDVSEKIREPEITEITYVAADNRQVRQELVTQQRNIAADAEKLGGLVTEGRDQGSIVFPNAEFKFYLDALPEVRAKRRVDQLAKKGIHVPFEEMLQQLRDRDQKDKNRTIGALTKTSDAIAIDTTPLTLDQVVQAMVRYIRDGQRAQSKTTQHGGSGL